MRMKKIVENRTLKAAAAEFFAFKRAQKIRERTPHDYQRYINRIRRTELMFPITERAVQKQLHIVCDYLGFEGISTYSFRKWYATEIYNANGFDIALVQRLLQHSSASTTQRYIGIEPQRIEQAIQNHANLI